MVGASEKLKTSLFNAFQGIRDYNREAKEKLPVLEKSIIELSDITAGRMIATSNLTLITRDLQDVLESFQSLDIKAQKAIDLAGNAMYHLKEYEDDPQKILNLLMDAMTELANEDLFQQTNPLFVSNVIEFVLPKVRKKSLKYLSQDKLMEWLDDVNKEIERRSEETT